MSLVNILAKALSSERSAILSAFPFRKSYNSGFYRLFHLRAQSRSFPGGFQELSYGGMLFMGGSSQVKFLTSRLTG